MIVNVAGEGHEPPRQSDSSVNVIWSSTGVWDMDESLGRRGGESRVPSAVVKSRGDR
jgi:hypothetical protein